jgi:hypothetical protein
MKKKTLRGLQSSEILTLKKSFVTDMLFPPLGSSSVTWLYRSDNSCNAVVFSKEYGVHCRQTRILVGPGITSLKSAANDRKQVDTGKVNNYSKNVSLVISHPIFAKS